MKSCLSPYKKKKQTEHFKGKKKSPVTKGNISIHLAFYRDSTRTALGEFRSVVQTERKAYWNLGKGVEVRESSGEGGCGWKEQSKSEDQAVFSRNGLDCRVKEEHQEVEEEEEEELLLLFVPVLFFFFSSLSGCQDKPLHPRHPWDKKEPVCVFFVLYGGFEFTTSQRSSARTAIFTPF